MPPCLRSPTSWPQAVKRVDDIGSSEQVGEAMARGPAKVPKVAHVPRENFWTKDIYELFGMMNRNLFKLDTFKVLTRVYTYIYIYTLNMYELMIIYRR